MAISKHRLINVDDKGVTFRWRDYRDNRQKLMTLQGEEFLRRFCQHIPPKGFVHIRHYGILAVSKWELLRELKAAFGIIVPLKRKKCTWKEICVDILDYNPDVCPCCGKCKMITIERLLPSRAPPVQYHIVKSHKRSKSN